MGWKEGFNPPRFTRFQIKPNMRHLTCWKTTLVKYQLHKPSHMWHWDLRPGEMPKHPNVTNLSNTLPQVKLTKKCASGFEGNFSLLCFLVAQRLGSSWVVICVRDIFCCLFMEMEVTVISFAHWSHHLLISDHDINIMYVLHALFHNRKRIVFFLLCSCGHKEPLHSHAVVKSMDILVDPADSTTKSTSTSHD